MDRGGRPRCAAVWDVPPHRLRPFRPHHRPRRTKRPSRQIFKKRLYDQGDIYKGKLRGLVLHPLRVLLHRNASSTDGKCPDCGRPGRRRPSEEAYFFRMSKYADRLMQYYRRPSGVHPAGIPRKMRWSTISSSPAFRICACPAPPSAGASQWSLTRAMWSMCGWML